jgi:hypothetical protein
MMLRRIERLDEYRESLERDPGELAALYQDFLIRVTAFFCDPEAFDVLRHDVLPTLCEGRSAKEAIRIWVPGCATGEEVYSVAIAVLEYLGDGLPSLKIQIFGTDVSEAALEKARAGVYPVNALHEVSPDRLRRFFRRAERRVPDLEGHSRSLPLRAAGPDQRSAVLAIGPDQLPQSPDLSRRCRATPGPPNIPLRASSAGHAVFGPADSVAHSPELFEQTDSRSRVFRRIPNTGGAVAQRADGSASSAFVPNGDTVPLHPRVELAAATGLQAVGRDVEIADARVIRQGHRDRRFQAALPPAGFQDVRDRAGAEGVAVQGAIDRGGEFLRPVVIEQSEEARDLIPQRFAPRRQSFQQRGGGGHRQPEPVARTRRIRLARGLNEPGDMRLLLDHLARVVAAWMARDFVAAGDQAHDRGTRQQRQRTSHVRVGIEY